MVCVAKSYLLHVRYDKLLVKQSRRVVPGLTDLGKHPGFNLLFGSQCNDFLWFNQLKCV